MQQSQLKPLQQPFSHVFRFFSRFARKLTPHHLCLLCEENSPERICTACQCYLVSPRYRCQRCGLPLQHHALICGECLKHPPSFDYVYCPFLYTSPLDKLINDFKHKHQFITGQGISDLFCQAIDHHYRSQHLTLPQWITPVPLHWRRQWQRGFNQAAFFSTNISQQLGIKLFPHAKRKQHTASQEGFSRKQRLQNLRNSFHITQSLNGGHIAIVDDVMTTGTTANSLASALKKAGAGKVSVWAVARTPKRTTEAASPKNKL